MKTDSVYPVKKGAEVFVSCVEGFTLTPGDMTITCVQDTHYTFRDLQICTIGVCNMLRHLNYEVLFHHTFSDKSKNLIKS